jgi:protein TonB
MSTKNQISLILLLQLLLATPLFANTCGLDTVIPQKKDRCIVRFDISPVDAQATVMYKSTAPDAVEQTLGTADKNGSVAGFLEFGEYRYRVVSKEYIAAEGNLLLNKACRMVVENVTLSTAFSNITFKAEGNDIYINGAKVGTGEWSAKLRSGCYIVECRRENHRSTVQVIEVFEGCDEVYHLSPAVPIVGELLLLSKPLDARVVIDGVDYGLSPICVSNLLVGRHEVEVSKAGYISRKLNVVIEENIATEQEVELEKKVIPPPPPQAKKIVDVIKIVEENVEIEEQELVSVQDMSEFADVSETDAIFVEEEIDEEQIFDVVEENPEFPGGMKELAKYLHDNIDYPRISRDNNSQGRAFVQFTVNADGSIQDVEIIRSTGDVYLDKEAIRVAEAMPKWKPGKQQGKAVRVKYRLPINFRLQ